MQSNNNRSSGNAQARLDRLTPLTRRIIENKEKARQYVELSKLARAWMVSTGFSPTPGLGLPEFDALVAIVRDGIGDAPLTDEEFERALYLSTPPEFRHRL